MLKNLYILIFFLNVHLLGYTQNSDSIKWLSFEQLEDSLKVEPKKTFVYFYTDWCVYCKKMERNAFRNPAVIKKLQAEFYAVKMNAESRDTINFDGQIFYNHQSETQRNGIHQIPLLLLSREGRGIAFPVLLVLDENFKVKERKFEYLTGKSLKEFLADQ